MSGICGIVHFDGANADVRLLREMNGFMAFRGPDLQRVWSDGAVGLGHAQLATTFESKDELQPFSFDGVTWITADARIDARAELTRSLAARGRAILPAVTDPELILHAWHAWGEDCVQHLLGDFVFAIWDARSATLFCARDPFGVKPFFYSRTGQHVVFSNTLNCVRVDPAVSSRLDDLAIADFLLFEMNQDPAGTVFADIRRLPPGECMTVACGGTRVRKYWNLPWDASVRYRRSSDYVDHFMELLGQAVADRLRAPRVGVEMSGGLDSTTVAATALRCLERQPGTTEIGALTIVYERLIPDDERRFATLAAQALGIPVDFFVADEYRLYEGYGGSAARFPEPVHDPIPASSEHAFRAAAARTRVMLTGWDGDALFNESPKPYFRSLLAQRRYGALLTGMARYGISQKRLVPLTLRQWLRRRGAQANAPIPPYPRWVSREFEARLGLRERWERVHREAVAQHPVRPYAFRILDCIIRTSNFFDAYDAGLTGQPLEYRHPLLDVRVVDYCLRLPPLPWCVKKAILREAMRGVLPEPVRRRPKTPLAGHPEVELLRDPDSQWVDHFIPAPDLHRYVDRGNIPSLSGAPDRMESWSNLRPLSLSFWLQSLRPR